jgi:HlyD family secretion protein
LKKKHRVLKGVIIGVVIVAVITAGVLYATGFFGKPATASTQSYQIVKLRTGDLEKSVKGTGSLSAGGSTDVKSPIALKINEIKVDANQSVKKGDVLATVDGESVDATIATLQSSIESSDSQLSQLLKNEDSEAKVKANLKGRVKKIMVKDGSDVNGAMEKYGGLMILSTDDKMRLDITLAKAGSVKAGYEVTVKTGGESYDGVVESVSDDKTAAAVTLTDDGPALDANATAYYNGKKIGSGKLAVNEPVLVTATAGTVDDVRVDLNDRVYASTSLLYLKNVPYSQSYTSAADKRAEYAKELKAALQIKKAGAIVAQEDGIINTLTATDAKEVAVDEVLLSMFTGGATKLDVSIDELDISKVSVGQSVSIAMDAITDKTYEGEVAAISQVGTTSNGVTTYPVTVNVKDDGGLKIGMSATATITIEKHTGVLLLPISALQTSQGKQYVWKYTGKLPEDSSEDPGTRTEVQVGLSSDDYVEVTSGLTADDQVVVVRTRSSSTNGNNRQGGFEMFGGGGPQGMPGGMQGGGQNRRNNN